MIDWKTSNKAAGREQERSEELTTFMRGDEGQCKQEYLDISISLSIYLLARIRGNNETERDI
jgi:hypothetical protein